MTLRYSGAQHHISRYSCNRGWMDHGAPRCISFGGLRVDDAVEEARLTVVAPGAVAAAVAAGQDAAADPANRLVAAELEKRWNIALEQVAEIEAKVAAHAASGQVAEGASIADPAVLAHLAADLKSIWTAPSTDARLKKRIVRTVIHEVIADIIAAVRQLVLMAGDDVIAGMLNRNGLVTGNGNRWTRERVTSLRSHHRIPVHKPAADGIEPWLNLNDAAKVLHIISAAF